MKCPLFLLLRCHVEMMARDEIQRDFGAFWR